MSNLEIDLSGRVALVTGASRGIGARVAERMIDAAADGVMINYVSNESAARELASRLGDRAAVVQGNVGRPDDVERIVGATVERFGRLDILVNNAAIFELNEFDRESYQGWVDGWRRTLEVNLIGAANATFLAMREFRKLGGGKIINIASRAAFRGETEFADYGASKAGLVNLTRSIARACAHENIIATCVAPGFVETDMAADELAKHRDAIESQIPVGRVATVDDVANVVLFLASPLSDYLAGVTIDVNGGSYFH